MSTVTIPKMGPEPVLLSRKEVDALYDTLEAVTRALATLGVDYIVTGGSLLGAVRQHSILFCDDDIDIAIIENNGSDSSSSSSSSSSSVYNLVSSRLQELLGSDYSYQIRPWEGGDRVRPKRMNNAFLDLFVLRRFQNMQELREVVGIKKNGQAQSPEYVNGIVDTLEQCAVVSTELCPFWHFNTRKAIEMWPKEVYREQELFPLTNDLKMGPLVGIKGPRCPVLLLKRAFGNDCFDVFYQSASHNKTIKEPTSCTAAAKHHRVHVNNNAPGGSNSNGTNLPPLVAAGGTWESGEKVHLEDQHYLPMQPIARAARRPTLHNRKSLVRYLVEQSVRETAWLEAPSLLVNNMDPVVLSTSTSTVTTNVVSSGQPTPKRTGTVYMDGVFDMLHIGHLAAIRQCAKLGDRVIIGVTGDADAADYKRPPIISQGDRVALIEALREVDAVVCPCPLVVTDEFMLENAIDLVVHGFANDADALRQEKFFAAPTKLGKFRRIPYYNGLSTTDIINKIRALGETDEQPSTVVAIKAAKKPQWFGATIAAATSNAAHIQYDPFPLWLRETIDPHIRKSTRLKDAAMDAICKATGSVPFNATLAEFRKEVAKEGELNFDPELFPLRSSLLLAGGQDASCDLTRLHLRPDAKEELLASLVVNCSQFQLVFDEFVRRVCAPHLASLVDCEEIYYQAFPCIRIIQPDEFSIGPHADVAYGHHPCSVNFYVPLTNFGATGNASSLFMESRPGSEDWHPITGDYGLIKHFAGAVCTHWTTENKTDLTRASLDFRLIAGPFFHKLTCGGSQSGGRRDVYRSKDGYYNCCKRPTSGSSAGTSWSRTGPLLAPDARVGYPFTSKPL